MAPLAVVLLAGPLLAFAIALNYALLNGGDGSAPELVGAAVLAAIVGAAFIRIACAAAGSVPPF